MSHAGFDRAYGTNPAENYERYFVPAIGRPLAERFVRRAAVRPNDRVLDVACGTGIVARLVCQAGEMSGLVAGLDPNAAMLAVAEAVAPPSCKIEWHEAAAEQMPLPAESRDVVLCQMGLQFMTDRAAALTEMHRVMREGGRALLSVPGPIAGFFAVLASAMERHVGPRAAGFVRRVFSLHDVDELEHSMSDAGFVDVTVEVEDQDLGLPPPHEFLWQYVHSTPLAAVASQTDADRLTALEREVLEASAEFVRDGVLEHRQRLVLVSGAR